MNIYSHNNLFLSNKYTRWYYNTIENAQIQGRIKSNIGEYYEYHHILPKSIFPKYSSLIKNPWNGVLLTAKEHYICHALLCKMTYNNEYYKMLFAFNCLSIQENKHQSRYTSRLYGSSKQNIIKTLKIINTGSKRSEETKQKMRKPRSLEGRQNISEGCKLKSTRRLSKSHKLKISNSNKNKLKTESHKLKISKSMKGKPPNRTSEQNFSLYKEKFECPHCGKLANKINIKRWHFDNCREI
jgi:hypothetical protein